MANEIVEATLAQMTSMGKKLRGLIRELSADVKTLKETGGQANVLERVKVNGRLLTPDSNKTVDVTVPTKVGQLENDASYQENKIETIQVNGTTQSIIGKTVNVHVPTAVGELTNDAGYQTNVLEGVKVNGLALEIDKSKNVDISIPTKVSELTNDKVYQTKTEVENAVKTAVAESKHLTFQKVSSVPAVEDASEDVMYLVMNPVTKHYDIYAKLVDESGNVIMDQLDDTTVDLSGYVEKEAGKGLSHNDFTDALLAKLNGIAEKANLYVHPSHTAYAEGLYKMTVNVLGHVTKATSVTKGDITALGIPGQDTHDWAGITDKPATFPPSAHNHDERYYTETETDKLLGGKSDTGHVHDDRYYTETEMDAKLSKKSDTGHTHDDRYYTESELDTKLAGKSATGHKHLWADITNKPSTFAPSAHKHVKADISDFPASMPASDVSAWAKAASKPSYGWSEITGKPSTFTPSGHTHDDRYYTESEMDAKLAKKADTHSHPYLPTAGGNMGGTAMIAWPDSGNWSNKNDGVTFPVKRGGLSWSGQSDGIQLFAEETGNDNLELILQFADDNSNGLTIRNKSGAAVSRLDANGGFSGSVAWEKITGKPSTFTPATHSHAWGDVTGKPSTFAPSAHKHVKADITDFPTSLPASDVKAWAKAANKPSYSWGEITNKPSTFAPAGHKHVKADITDFPTLGTAAAKNVGDFAAASHSHSWDSVTGKPSTFTPSSHNHNYAGSSSAGGTANSVNGFTFGVQTSDPGANSSLTTNKFLFVYE